MFSGYPFDDCRQEERDASFYFCGLFPEVIFVSGVGYFLIRAH